MRLGFIVAGLMGGPLARNLIRAGYPVLVFDLSREAVDRTLAAGETGQGGCRKAGLRQGAAVSPAGSACRRA